MDLFGRARRRAATARAAELGGELAKAVLLWADAGEPGEAARVMILRGDSEADPTRRLPHYIQAAATAPEGHASRAAALKKRALLVMALASESGASAVARHDLLEAARDLESVGEPESAAEAYARAGDTDGQARALAQAGDVEKLELLLTDQHAKDRGDRRRHDSFAEIELLVASGRRREALAAAEVLAAASDAPAGAQTARGRAQQLRARRAHGPVARLLVNDAPVALVLGDEVIIGRTEGALQVASQAISRRHLALSRVDGVVQARDLGSRNGTVLRGLSIAGSVAVGDGVDLRLGKEVPLRLTPSVEMPGAIEIDLGGARYLAPLGRARLAVGAWRVEQGSDGWLELVTEDAPPAFIGQVQLVARATLLVGDVIARERGGVAVLRVSA